MKNNEGTSGVYDSSAIAGMRKNSLRSRLSIIILLSPLAPAIFLMLGIYYVFRFFLYPQNNNATTIAVAITAVVIATFLITILINIFVVKRYVTAPIMSLVDKVSRFSHILDSPEFRKKEQSTGGLDDVKRSYEDFRTVEGMADRIRHLETEINKIFFDPLTGIYNRRYLDKHFKQLTYTLSRSNSSMSVLMVDIDGFKAYNDFYGHLQGDECLRQIISLVLNCVDRTDDFVVRYGGDEFAVVLPNTDKAGAIHIAETLLGKVREQKIPNENNPATDFVTISIGATSGKIKHTHKAEDYLEKADAMLYKSKQSGRNMYNYCDLE